MPSEQISLSDLIKEFKARTNLSYADYVFIGISDTIDVYSIRKIGESFIKNSEV